MLRLFGFAHEPLRRLVHKYNLSQQYQPLLCRISHQFAVWSKLHLYHSVTFPFRLAQRRCPWAAHEHCSLAVIRIFHCLGFPVVKYRCSPSAVSRHVHSCYSKLANWTIDRSATGCVPSSCPSARWSCPLTSRVMIAPKTSATARVAFKP